MESLLNPQIGEVTIGIESLRKIRILPLSLKDEFHMTELIAKVLSEIAEETSSDSQVLIKIIVAVKENIKEVLGLVTRDEDVEEIVGEMTNVQVTELAKLIYEVNYEDTIKNLKDLIKKVSEVKTLMGS